MKNQKELRLKRVLHVDHYKPPEPVPMPQPVPVVPTVVRPVPVQVPAVRRVVVPYQPQVMKIQPQSQSRLAILTPKPPTTVFSLPSTALRTVQVVQSPGRPRTMMSQVSFPQSNQFTVVKPVQEQAPTLRRVLITPMPAFYNMNQLGQNGEVTQNKTSPNTDQPKFISTKMDHQPRPMFAINETQAI
jgi:hypothetical protein